jgi:hypothetical protein
MASAYGHPSYWRQRAEEERGFAATSRTRARHMERLALAERWDRRAREVEHATRVRHQTQKQVLSGGERTTALL